ncbi:MULTISPECIES: hypothetical protein [Methylomonas]|uniref:Uncharacterized protein n=2 Tax=Methylomonas TaxID=416 RepID=A0A140E6K6_9GAMM|nr:MULTISPECIES: hypothetical protein [Methylomonas]AMK79030.1 hypothetical protein JT25_021520 [Methylomonas denitrificans]OAI00193.1 hypothetical protein A1342_01345 [Methylomonas methanica]TCV79177.1 hypothetical protein EDE11_12151 [Methylomonas methanica]
MNKKHLKSCVWLFALLVVGLNNLASAVPGWTAPTALSTMTLFSLPANNASVVVVANGDSTAVWINESNNVVQYAQRKAGVWSAAKSLYVPSATKNETTSSAHVVVKSDGSAVAIFASTTPGTLQYCVSGGRVIRCLGPSKSFAKVATLSVGGTSWSKTNLSAQGILIDDTQIAVDASGNLLASWRYLPSAGQPTQLQMASQTTGGTWSTAQSVYSSNNPISLPSLSLAANGEALLAWQEKLTNGTSISFALNATYRDSRGVWSPVENPQNLAAQTWTLRTGIDGNGIATLVWDNNYSVQLSRRDNSNASSTWTTPITLASAPGTQYGYAGPFAAYSPDIAVSTGGDVLISWLESEASTGLWQIEAQILSANGLIQSAASWPVDPQTGNSYPSATISADGSAAAVGWIDNGSSSANVASFTPASGWGLVICNRYWLVGRHRGAG